MESYEDFHKQLIENLKAKLKEVGVSQRMQIVAGIDPKYLSKINQGKRNIGLKTLWKICHSCGIEISDLFKQQG